VSELAKIGEKFSIQLVIAKLESDGESMATFRLLDYEEIVPYFYIFLITRL